MGQAALSRERDMMNILMEEENKLDENVFESHIRHLRPTRPNDPTPNICVINPDECLRSKLLKQLPMLTSHSFDNISKWNGYFGISLVVYIIFLPFNVRIFPKVFTAAILTNFGEIY